MNFQNRHFTGFEKNIGTGSHWLQVKTKIILQFLKITTKYLPALRKVSKPGWLIFIFFTLYISVSFAQSGIIKGLVKDEETILPAATVSVANNIAVSNSNGEFSIVINPGTYFLVVTHAGYKKSEQEIIVKPNETQTVTISMIRKEQLGEVVILGSRSVKKRSNLNTPVPVDRITSKELIQTGQPSLIQMLNFTVPSFNTSRQNLFEPVTFRGLGPDHLLILMNGIRYHNPAVLNQGSIKGTLGRGGVGNDLNSIPFSAIEKIEILRDGASAQYGSDAIASVMNIELKKTTGKTLINLQTGQHYKGDGENFVFGINHGIPIGKRRPDHREGFLNFSGDFLFRNLTHRGGEYLGTVYYIIPSTASQAIRELTIALDNTKIRERGFNRKTPVSNDGSIQLTSSGFLINGGYPINSKMKFFCTGALNYRHPVYTGLYRFPKNTNQVNKALYPDGFKVKIYTPSWDLSGIAGSRGETNKGWHWEFSSAYGSNNVSYETRNTNNASQFAQGKNAQTEFNCGSLLFKQLTNSISFAKDFAKKINGIKIFNLGFGGESRLENYRIKKGEDASWKNYDTTNKTQGGSQGFSGFSDSNTAKANRNMIAMYVDLEIDINDHLLIDIASRYEYYSDFGNNLAGKLAMCYKLSSAFSIRGSLSNGYHAPALQQIYYSSTAPAWKNVPGGSIPIRLGTFSNNSAVAQAFGVKQLQPEKAVNLSGGITSTISQHISLTVDAYWIQIKNRIVLSGRFDRTTNSDVERILQNRPEVDQVQFITNAINTKTSGIDIVMNGNWKVCKASLGLMLAANFARTNIFGPIQIADNLKDTSTNTNTLFNREEKEKIENGHPGSKIILSANYKKGKVEILIRNTRFGKTSAVFSSADKSRDEFFSAKILTDVSINYSPKPWLIITAGANNIFDVYPDRLKNYLNTTEGILIYSNEAMPFGYNGGYYFLNMSFNF